MQYFEIFNYMASTIRILIDNIEEDFFLHYDGKTWKKAQSIKKILKQDLPELFGSRHEFISSLLERSLIEKLENTREKYSRENNYDMILSVLMKLDILLKEEFESYAMLNKYKTIEQNMNEEDSIEKLLCLNDNFSDCNLQLLPKCASKWSHTNREKISSNSINSYLKNCYYILNEKLGRYKVNHVFFTNEFARANSCGVLKIGMTPICNTAMLDISFYEENDTNYFKIYGLKNEEIVKKCVLNQLKMAKENDVDIMLFPEMLGAQSIIDVIEDELKKFNEEEKEYPEITLCPTVWENQRNTCIVFDKCGECIVEQEKQHPFPYKNDGSEHIEALVPNDTINLIHCDGIGRIAILICKDALQREYLHMVLEELKVTLLIIPSFSTGSYDFTEITQMCRAYDCCVLWINTCSVCMLDNVSAEKIQTKGNILRTGKANDEMENGLIEFQECKKNEGLYCEDCIFIGELLF